MRMTKRCGCTRQEGMGACDKKAQMHASDKKVGMYAMKRQGCARRKGRDAHKERHGCMR